MKFISDVYINHTDKLPIREQREKDKRNAN